MRRSLAVATLPLVFLSLRPAVVRGSSEPSWVAWLAGPSATTGVPETPQTRLEKADVLPLALDDRYQFRKVEQFVNEPKFFKPTADALVAYERQRVNYGAVTSLDHLELRGHYFGFYWRTRLRGPVRVRFEYRQANLGSYVQAKEVAYNDPRGTVETRFQVIGDDYAQDGRVIAWRALLIADGRIVGLTQSYLWD